MTLVKITTHYGTVVCAVQQSENPGGFTLCGYDMTGGTDEYGYGVAGQEFQGTLKQVTCPMCKRIIAEIKSWR